MNSIEIGRNYDKIAKWWINAQMQNPEYGMEHIRKAIKYTSEKSKALDLGCGGTGRTISEVVKYNFTVTGIDVSSEMIKSAKRKHPKVRFIHADYISWDTEETFDLIIAWDSIFHAPRELQEFVTVKMCNMLNPCGILLFTAGAYEGDASSKMESVLFEYGSIGYKKYLEILERMNCKIILMEEDQYPSGHMAFICEKAKQSDRHM